MTGIAWNLFTLNGKTYDLTHLYPFAFEFVVDAKDGKPEQRYAINVAFSLHCFTRGLKEGEAVDADQLYRDNREERVIDLARYKLSHRLPDIIHEIGRRKCFHTGHANFFTVEVIDEDGENHDYSVFFAVTKAGKGRRLNLFVQSAYVSDRIPTPTKRKPIKFMVIAHNTATNKPIRTPR